MVYMAEKQDSPHWGFMEYFLLSVALATAVVPLVSSAQAKEDYKDDAVSYCKDHAAGKIPENYGEYSGSKCSGLELKIRGSAN